MENKIINNYKIAKEKYEELGVDVDKALKRLSNISISVNCWQGDDVKGFIFKDTSLSGGIQVTGNYPYRARNFSELSSDLSKALSLIPGKQRVNLHGMYAVSDNDIDLDEIEPIHFKPWVKWAKKEGVALDFNPTCFSHPLASDGFTLSSNNKKVRNFFIEHVKRSRQIAKYFALELNKKSVCNIWIPDGYKDTPYDRLAPRLRLKESLDEIYSEEIDSNLVLDTLESKLFGIGVEGYTTGTHEFYLSYAIKNNKSICLDSGHFHPTETISDKIPSLMPFFNEIALHVTRPMRWDSDHIVSFDDDVSKIAEEIIRNNLDQKVYIGLDFFDASINRVAAWVIGVRNTQKALLKALLEPYEKLKDIEVKGDYTKRLAYMEELKTYPFGAIYDYYCYMNHVPTNLNWLKDIKKYEQELKR